MSGSVPALPDETYGPDRLTADQWIDQLRREDADGLTTPNEHLLLARLDAAPDAPTFMESCTITGDGSSAVAVNGRLAPIASLRGVLIDRRSDGRLDISSLPPAAPDALGALDGAYRERNAVVAALIRTNGWPAEVVMAPDTEGWFIVYAQTPQGQVSWHIGPDDMDLFRDWSVAFGTRPSPWDGHTTEEKYRRLAALSPASAEAESRNVSDYPTPAPDALGALREALIADVLGMKACAPDGDYIRWDTEYADESLHYVNREGVIARLRAALSPAPAEAEGPTYGADRESDYGVAKPAYPGTIPGRGNQTKIGSVHPFPAPEPAGIDVEGLVAALRVVDRQIAEVAGEEHVDDLIGPDAETGRRQYAEALAAAYDAEVKRDG